MLRPLRGYQARLQALCDDGAMVVDIDTSIASLGGCCGFDSWLALGAR